MVMNKLISSIVSDAKKEAEEVIKSAESEVDKLIAEEKAKRVILLKNAEEDCHVLLSDQKRERIAWARLEAKRVIAEAKEDSIKGVIFDMHELLSDLRKSKEYEAFMKNGVQQASDEFSSGDDLVLHLVKGDKKYVSKFKGKIVEDLDATGGFIVETSDGAVRVDFTLESVLESKKDEVRKRIYEKLFEA